ncbi:hypothetical protein [Lysinibacillus xylanilyticus]|uniref:hypothetical protein n=1 Tax=Lysinibacillus xylanilyticus TaxID=582475 RepID=UPI003CFD238F
MLQSELLRELSTNQSEKWDASIMKAAGFAEKTYIDYITNCLKGVWNVKEKKWSFREDLYSVDIPTKIAYEFYNLRLQVPVQRMEWGCEKGFISREYLHQLLKIFLENDLEDYNPRRIEQIIRYIFDVLYHPLDILLVTQDMLRESSSMNKSYIYKYLCAVQTIYLSVCLRNKIKIPLQISLNCMNKFPVSIIGGPGEIRNKLSKFAIYFINNIEMDTELLFSEFQYKKDMELKSLNKANNLIYIIVAILLETCTNNWSEVNIKNFHLKKWKFVFEFYNKQKRDQNKDTDKQLNKISISFLFELKTGFKLNKMTFASFDEQNEIESMLIQTKYYLMQKKLALTKLEALRTIFETSAVTKINELSLKNLKSVIQKYLSYCENKVNRKTISAKLRNFCNGLLFIKEVFERENILGIQYKFPFEPQEIKVVGVTQHDTLFLYAFEQLDKHSFSTDNGTFKEDILKVDSIARAIKNYEMKCKKDENILSYFMEFQLLTMLRIVVETGVRVSEVINIPYHFIGRVENEDMDVLILSLNKLGEEFGVVPISKKTAKMVYECINLRKTYFPETIQDMGLFDENKIKPTLKYPLQFINISSRLTNSGFHKGKYVHPHILKAFLDDICEENQIKRTKGKVFHMFRHRTAEYFFFCMSYYDAFEFKDDEEYKTEVVKKILRHNDVGMTESYSWGSLLNRVAEKKLIFLKSLPSLTNWNSSDSVIHQQSVIKKINDDLAGIFTNQSIERISKLLTAPAGLIQDSVLNELSKNQSFKIIQQNLRKIDGNKGVVPNGYAYFGLCTQFNCPKLKNRNKLTCESCDELVLESNHIVHLIGTIVRCQESLYSYGKSYIEDRNHYNHVHSLRARSINAQNKLFNEFNFSADEILFLIAEYYEGKLELGV